MFLFVPLRFTFTSSCLYDGYCLIYVIYVCLCVVVSNTYYVVLFCFTFVLCLVYPMLLVSLDFPFLIAPSVFSGLSILDWLFRFLYRLF